MKHSKIRLFKHLEENITHLSRSDCPHKTETGNVSRTTWNCSGRGIGVGVAQSTEQAIQIHLDYCIEVYGKDFK